MTTNLGEILAEALAQSERRRQVRLARQRFEKHEQTAVVNIIRVCALTYTHKVPAVRVIRDLIKCDLPTAVAVYKEMSNG